MESIGAGGILMPLYALISWYGLIKDDNTGEYILQVSLVGWIWAVVNTYTNQELDLGAITFFFVVIISLYEKYKGVFTRGIKWSLIISSLLAAANYGLVFILWKGLEEAFVSNSKSDLWIAIFYWYCVAMMIFWIWSSIKTYKRTMSEGGYAVVY